MYLVHIRYKDGRDKLVTMKSSLNLVWPSVTTRSIPHYPPTNPNVVMTAPASYETFHEIIPAAPVQPIWDSDGNMHYINIEEILDITVEDVQ